MQPITYSTAQLDTWAEVSCDYGPTGESGRKALSSTLEYRTNLSKEEARHDMIMTYVLRGYCSGGDYTRCMQAAFEMHTETLNAWTMFINSVISALMFGWVAQAVGYSPKDLVPFAALTGAVLVHMPFSVGNHLFGCISVEVHNLWRRLDQMLLLAALVPTSFALAWHVYSSWVGVAVNTAVAAAAAVQAIRQVRGVEPHHSWGRLEMLLLVSLNMASLGWPMVYYTLRALLSGKFAGASAYAIAWLVAAQLGSWAFYHNFPEKYFPGVFDLVGHSHQLMHVALMVGCVLKYMFVWELHKVSVA